MVMSGSMLLMGLLLVCGTLHMQVAPRPNTFLPFGNGAHACPGNELAKLEMLVLIHHLVTGYRCVQLLPDSPYIYFRLSSLWLVDLNNHTWLVPLHRSATTTLTLTQCMLQISCVRVLNMSSLARCLLARRLLSYISIYRVISTDHSYNDSLSCLLILH